MKKSKVVLNFIDVFSGAGGLSCGMELAGHRCLLGIDANPHAIQTFDHNHKYANVFCGDIKKLTEAKLNKLVGENNEIHAIVGGPPCQGFSTVGPGDPLDQRNQLFLEFVRLVKIKKPYFVVLENVTGLVAKKNESTLKAIFSRFQRLGYNLNVQVMSAHHYGVPEKRRRTIIFGTRINESPEFPPHLFDTILGKSYIPPRTVGDALQEIEKAPSLFNHDIQSARIASDLDKKRLAHIPEGKGIRYQKDELSYLPPRLRLKIKWDELPEGRFRQTKYQRLDRNLPGPTIMTHRHSYYHPTENRYLTAREAASIQSFPTDFEFFGPLSAQWRQIGNAVPPLLGKAIGESMTKMVLDAEKNGMASQQKKKPQDIHHIRGKAFVYKEKYKDKKDKQATL